MVGDQPAVYVKPQRNTRLIHSSATGCRAAYASQVDRQPNALDGLWADATGHSLEEDWQSLVVRIPQGGWASARHPRLAHQRAPRQASAPLQSAGSTVTPATVQNARICLLLCACTWLMKTHRMWLWSAKQVTAAVSAIVGPGVRSSESASPADWRCLRTWPGCANRPLHGRANREEAGSKG